MIVRIIPNIENAIAIHFIVINSRGAKHNKTTTIIIFIIDKIYDAIVL